MPAYNFQRRFVPAIRTGIKRSTIRRRRKDGRDAKVGQTLYLFTGMRTKQCLRLLETRCERVRPINIIQRAYGYRIRLRGEHLNLPQVRELALHEGFDSISDMTDWFKKHHGNNFSGLLIEW
jgi:hypothetical protein